MSQDPQDPHASQDPIAITPKHNEAYSDEGFWSKVKGYAKKIGSTGLYYALVLYYMSVDENVPFSQKAIVVGALGYLILPIDVIPDALFGIGFSDDIGVMLTALRAVKDSITLDHLKLAEEKLKGWFPDVDVPSADFLS